MVSGTMEDGVGIFFMNRRENVVSPVSSSQPLVGKPLLDLDKGQVLGIAPAEQKWGYLRR